MSDASWVIVATVVASAPFLAYWAIKYLVTRRRVRAFSPLVSLLDSQLGPSFGAKRDDNWGSWRAEQSGGTLRVAITAWPATFVWIIWTRSETGGGLTEEFATWARDPRSSVLTAQEPSSSEIVRAAESGVRRLDARRVKAVSLSPRDVSIVMSDSRDTRNFAETADAVRRSAEIGSGLLDAVHERVVAQNHERDDNTTDGQTRGRH